MKSLPSCHSVTLSVQNNVDKRDSPTLVTSIVTSGLSLYGMRASRSALTVRHRNVSLFIVALSLCLNPFFLDLLLYVCTFFLTYGTDRTTRFVPFYQNSIAYLLEVVKLHRISVSSRVSSPGSNQAAYLIKAFPATDALLQSRLLHESTAHHSSRSGASI